MSKDYGQFCGLAKAAQALGERWALLVVRDLTIGPRRFGELLTGLPGIPTTVLTTRLRELEAHGIVERRVAAAGARGVVYALTAYGEGLTPVLDALGRWGARRMLVPDEHDVITDSSLAAALHAAYQPGVVTRQVTYLIRSGPATAWSTTRGGDVAVGGGEPSTAADLVITAGPALREVLAGRLSAADAVRDGAVELSAGALPTDATSTDHTGASAQPDAALLAAFEEFTRAFHVQLDADAPAASPATA